MTQQAIAVSGKTGETCQVSGPYVSDGSKMTVFFSAKDKFPVDPTTGQNTTWRMVKE
jgi:hypothetical protein